MVVVTGSDPSRVTPRLRLPALKKERKLVTPKGQIFVLMFPAGFPAGMARCTAAPGDGQHGLSSFTDAVNGKLTDYFTYGCVGALGSWASRSLLGNSQMLRM